MKYLTLIFTSLLILLFTPACKDDDQQFGDCFVKPNKTQLKLTKLEGPTVELPSKVSVFFKVQDANNNPVGYLNEDNFVIYEKGLNDSCLRVISKSEAKRRISGREQVFNHTTMLVLDLSGSVLQNSLAELKQAAITFIDEIMPDTIDNSTTMGIWWFDGEDKLHLLRDVTPDAADLKVAINSISSNISKDNSTDLFGAVIKASSIAKAILAEFKDKDISAAASVVFFTDGRDRANRYLRQDAYNAVATSPQGITYFTLGVGNEINPIDLQTIGRNGYQEAPTVAQLTAVFKQIAALVTNEANSYYFFEYCSPIRNGSKNSLIIEAFEGNEVGYLETQFDATGFTGGCQL
jgi:uncharacterized protein YegL